MPLSENERQILAFNLRVETVPPEADAMSVDAAVQMLIAAYNGGRVNLKISDDLEDSEETNDDAEKMREEEGPNLMLISDMAIDDFGVATILFSHGDSGAPDPALIDMTTHGVRTAGKKPTESVAHAAHLLISTLKHISPLGQSRALLERAPGVGRSTSVSFLNRVLRKEAAEQKLTFKDPVDGRMKRYHPRFASASQLSHHLKNDLEEGRLSRIDFIRWKVSAGFEEPNRVEAKSETYSCKVVNSPTGIDVYNLIRRATGWGKENKYDDIQLFFRNKKTRKSQSPRFSTELKDAADAVYARLETIDQFAAPLRQCPTVICDEVALKMKNIFDDGDVWK